MVQPRLLRTTFSDVEIAELQRFLERRCVPLGGMDLSTLDGYLTAIVSGPEPILLSEWQPRVWAERRDDAVPFESDEKSLRITMLILRRMDEISRNFAQETIEPIFFETVNDQPRSDFADGWCAGYVIGIALRPDAWKPLTTEDGPLAPILVPAADPSTVYTMGDEEHGEVATEIVTAAFGAYARWHEPREKNEGIGPPKGR